jgi:tRNA (guanosine-2'-O-)-methyltransferase
LLYNGSVEKAILALKTYSVNPTRYQKLQQILNQRQPDLTVLAENVKKPHNLSAILRTCDAVGVFEAHAVNPTGGVPTYSSVAQGSQKWVPLRIHADIESAIACLQERNFTLYAAHLSPNQIDYRQIDYTQPTAIVLGTEKFGVSDETASLVDHHIRIPMVGMVQSLNVSVAAATIVFEAMRQRQAAGYYDSCRLDQDTYRQVLFEWSYPEVAERYRKLGKPYPPLNEVGDIVREMA